MAKPKNTIKLKTKIKSCNVKGKNDGLSFDAVSLKEPERKRIIELVKKKAEIWLYLEPVQGELFKQ